MTEKASETNIPDISETQPVSEIREAARVSFGDVDEVIDSVHIQPPEIQPRSRSRMRQTADGESLIQQRSPPRTTLMETQLSFRYGGLSSVLSFEQSK